ncbi:hypothetical protein IPA_05890 [Ignicoccus pacificus DSM 13166]|uniref:Methyltransferase small domain-containing protein n=1 Tax=Ignicoccus pacificus DSM 13166 TaxID=940294 RepID=A0A977K9P7_9CREN|nr:hypothetical protein IPA_05890 [Ignicoccus pacificus DSM 13166]
MRMNVNYKFRGFPVINRPWLEQLLKGKKSINENGIILTIEIMDREVKLGPLVTSLSELRKAMEFMGTEMYAVTEKGLVPLEIRGEHFYRLRGLEKVGPPTIEINGIHMHRVSKVDPWSDTLSKVRPLNIRKGDRVLDTCMGLGYTAIASLKRGAKVITVEKSDEVLWLAQWNPWSRELEEVEVLKGDVAELIKDMEDESFDKIIHDPPVITMAGHLYSKEFYEELYRVLKVGGKLFHYTGNTGRRRGIDLARGVMERLREVGFEVKRYEKALGVLAIKG